MPLNDLLDAIAAEANEERARVEGESRAEAEAVLKRAHKEAARAREEILRAHAPATEGEAKRRLALARLEAQRAERDAREEAFSNLTNEVRTSLAAARDEPGYRDALRALLDEALSALPDASTARVNPKDEALAAGLLREMDRDLHIVHGAGVIGGVVLESAGGRAVRNTLEERLTNAEPLLRSLYGGRLEALSVAAR